MTVPSLTDIELARMRIDGRLHVTPVFSSSSIGDSLGVRLHLKAELLQKTGSFKPRGVLNKLATLTQQETARGIVSMSAGNHAAALSWAATAIGAKATIVMPTSAAAAKISATEAYGGTVVLTDEPLMDVVHRIQEETGSVLVHPFDDPATMAGTGTIGLEILEQVPDVDTIIVPIGGGGLIGGVAAAVKQATTAVRILGVEPEAANTMVLSLAKGEPVQIPMPGTIADGLAAPFAGVHTLESVQQHVDQVVTVTDEDIAVATRLLHERTKLFVEPSAAAPLAAVQTGALAVRPGEKLVMILSGGNVNQAVLANLMTASS